MRSIWANLLPPPCQAIPRSVPQQPWYQSEHPLLQKIIRRHRRGWSGCTVGEAGAITDITLHNPGTIMGWSSRLWENMLCTYCLHPLVCSVNTLLDVVITLHQFIAQAEEKITQCITVPLDPEPQIEQICGVGVDPTFDQLISALGHISSQKPKPLIDSMMLWRKNKSDAANEARTHLQQVRRFKNLPLNAAYSFSSS